MKIIRCRLIDYVTVSYLLGVVPCYSEMYFVEKYVEDHGGCKSYKEIFNDSNLSKMISKRPERVLTDSDARAIVIFYRRCAAEASQLSSTYETDQEARRIEATVARVAASTPMNTETGPSALVPERPPVQIESSPPNIQEDGFERGRGVGIGDLTRNVDRLQGKLVTPLYINACFTYDNKHICTGSAPSIFGKILVVANEFANDDWRDIIDRRCNNLASAISCRPQWISFIVDRYGTDMSGNVGIVYTKKINASKRLR